VTVGGPKVAHPPLLPPGRHVFSVEGLRQLTVDAFPGSTQRPLIFAELERLISDLSKYALVGELWIDGSFLTEKSAPEPDDVDLSFVFHVDDLQRRDAETQQFVLHTLNGSKKYSPLLDTYICVLFYRNDPRRSTSRQDYWAEKWSKGWDDRLKGFAVLRLGDVGYQLFA
jgi:hypothetical protein